MEKETKLQIYPNREKIFEMELKRLQRAQISPRNKELITEYQNYCFSSSKALRVAKLSSQTRTICRWLASALGINKDLDLLDRKDALQLVAFISRLEGKSEVTKADYRRALKQFYRWFKKEDTRLYSKDEEKRLEATKFYEFLENEVHTAYKIGQADPKTILTDEDIRQVVEAGCHKPKDKAFIICLHETGARAAEFLNLKIGDIIIKDGYAEIHIPDGKTGKRVVYIRDALPYLLRYLDVHPFKNNLNSYLWISDAQDQRKANQPIVHIGARRLVDRCFTRANVAKRHNLHWFRHSRASILAPKLTESMLCRFMGWTLGSDQVRTYIHLCNKQMEDVFLAMNGISTKEVEAEKPVKCLCGALNSPRERYCFRCYKPLSVAIAIQDNAEETKRLKLISSEAVKTFQFFMEMQKSPELMKKFEEFKHAKVLEEARK